MFRKNDGASTRSDPGGKVDRVTSRFTPRRMVSSVVITLTMVLGSVFAAAGPAAAVEYEHFQNWATNGCLDSDFNGNTYIMPCQEGNDWQTWRVGLMGATGGVTNWGADGTLRWIQNLKTGRCLDIQKDAELFQTNVIKTTPCNLNDRSQIWTPRLPTGSWQNFQWISTDGSFNQATLDANTTSTYPNPFNGGMNQTWRMVW